MGLFEDVYNWVVSSWNWITTKGYELENWLRTEAPIISNVMSFDIPIINMSLNDILSTKIPYLNLSIDDIRRQVTDFNYWKTEFEGSLRNRVWTLFIQFMNQVYPGLGTAIDRITNLWNRYNPFDPRNWQLWMDTAKNQIYRILTYDIPAILTDLAVKGDELVKQAQRLLDLSSRFDKLMKDIDAFLKDPNKWFWSTLLAVLEKFVAPDLKSAGAEISKLVDRELSSK